MTKISRDTKECFELEQRYGGRFGSPERVECQLADSDGTPRLFVNSMELTEKQCARLAQWLDRAHRVLTGFKGM